jgi:hypothetical protein
MLSPQELAMAQQLFEKLRELTAPREPEFVRDGAELAQLLGVSRSKAWALTKRPDFNRAAPARELGPRLKQRKRAQVLVWWEDQKDESPGAASGPGTHLLARAERAGVTNNKDGPDGSAPRRPRASRRLR